MLKPGVRLEDTSPITEILGQHQCGTSVSHYIVLLAALTVCKTNSRFKLAHFLLIICYVIPCLVIVTCNLALV